MSDVTNVLISFSVMEDSYEADDDDIYPIMFPIDAWLTEQGYGAFGPDIDHVSGGHKHLETPVYAAGFNHFALGEFLEMLRTLSWKHPECVQVFVQEQDENTFRVMGIIEHHEV